MMTHSLPMNSYQKILACLALCAGLALPSAAHAALVNLATAPLANSTTTTVLPNIMFTLDDSGSMTWDFMPDWVYSYSRASQPNLYRNSAWNVTYYNPAITYTPPVHFNADGTLNTATYPSKASGWNSVKYDAYGVLSYYLVSGLVQQLCPDGSIPSAGAPNGACDLTGGRANFFTFVPGEYCTLPNLKVCVTASAPSASYPYPAPLRWCNNVALAQSGGTNACQSIRIGAFTYKRHPGAVGATATLTVSGNVSTSVNSVVVNGLEILSAATSASTTSSTVATRIKDNINACTTTSASNCTTAGYKATVSGSVVTITAPGAITYTPVVTISGTMTITPTAFSGGLPGNTVYTEIDPAIISYPYPGSAAKHPNRTDCVGTTCTHDEEMTNYANWFTYYHTRMSMMKSGVSRAFKAIDNKYRVGFNTINYTGATDGTRFLHIDKFELAHKNSWYSKLFAANADGGTPLQNSLGKVGRLFANKVSGQQDPVQYSCQQNFSILSTDGYWNSSTGTYSLSSGSVGNLDGGATPRPMYEGPTATSDTLADIAKYYYDTDLRTSALTNCTGSLGLDVCENNVFVSATDNNIKQHMTSFTIGLGADGTLVYQDDYLTATAGDFYNLKNNLNSVNWPNPLPAQDGTRIDDLWHAAVNGRGEYFSAKNPDQIVKGLEKALASMKSKVGAGAAAATSTLNPVSSDNKAFVASYTTVSWRGNLEARLIDLTTGATSKTAAWCAEDVVAATCTAPSYLENYTGGGSNVWYCVTPSQTTCVGGTLVGSDCKIEVPASCTGTLKNKVTASSDTRTIYMKDASGSALTDFKYDYMTASQKAYFNTPTALSQWPGLTAPQQTLASGANLVNYLRGQTGYEDRTVNTDKLYRYREATLGDAVESEPRFIGKPVFSYTDTGYDAFKTAQANRAKTIFLGANDGMLHAFNADTGEERWAYVPSMVMPKMWKLADKNYATMHTNYVNGTAVISDIHDGTSWKSILVGSLHGGGRGYYALDVTDPAAPTFLWEFTYTQTTDHALKMDDDLGYSFANPKIGKRPSDGKWVVFLTSGYNNANEGGGQPGDGKGYVYVLDPLTGTVLNKIGTGAGDATTPSGLAKIEFYADASERDNTAKYIYGGDLDGNLWRIDMSNYSLLKFAVLKDSAGVVQPITTRPEFAKIYDKRVVYVATGKYLEISDLVATQQNTLYAIKDDNATATFINPRSGTGADTMVQRTWTNAGANRTVSGSTVDWVSQRGWYADFPDLGERANVDPRLEFGTLLVPTTVPSNTVCAPGGYGYVNYVDYKTGLAAAGSTGGYIGLKTNTPPVGVNLVMLPDGSIVVSVVESEDHNPKLIPGVGFSNKSGGFQGKRVIWRELVP
ncbi:MAG: PilC/PilY family type IV pilus protein [Sulfurimicrobium sp.]|nr:PilC/PilY family type IV pilus protein [Sulfurimicrobium sp.]